MDLNLLTALEALLEEQSVGAAAERLHLSAPAMSRTLHRIRRATGDEILVRSGRTMTPTARALALREEVRDLVRRAEAVLAPHDELDLAALERTFTVQGHEALLTALVPELLGRVAHAAPGVRLRLLAEPAVDAPDLVRGHLDLVLGTTAEPGPDVRVEPLGEDRLVVALRAGHPLATGELTAARFAEAQHVVVSRRGRLRDRVDEQLAAQGLRRQVLAALPTASAALHLVARSDVVVCITARACAALVDALGLRTADVPVELPRGRASMAWHRRQDSDPAHRWLRGQVRDAFGSLGAD